MCRVTSVWMSPRWLPSWYATIARSSIASARSRLNSLSGCWSWTRSVFSSIAAMHHLSFANVCSSRLVDLTNCQRARVEKVFVVFFAELSLSGSSECAVRLQRCCHSDQPDLHSGTLASTWHGMFTVALYRCRTISCLNRYVQLYRRTVIAVRSD